MLQLLPARVGIKRSPDLTLTGLQVALTHYDGQRVRDSETINNPAGLLLSRLVSAHTTSFECAA